MTPGPLMRVLPRPPRRLIGCHGTATGLPERTGETALSASGAEGSVNLTDLGEALGQFLDKP
jgi:hypothetical protein